VSPLADFIEMVPNGVEGLELNHQAGGRVENGRHAVDTEDFGGILAADVRDDMVLGFVLFTRMGSATR